RQEAPEHDGVHDTGIGLGERPYLAERVLGHELHALRDLVEAVLRLPRAPELDALPHPPREERDGDDAAGVQQDLRPAGNVPESIAERNGRGHARSNDTMGNMASTAE